MSAHRRVFTILSSSRLFPGMHPDKAGPWTWTLEASPDTEYRQFMPARDFLLATAYTWPLLLMYRYKLRK